MPFQFIWNKEKALEKLKTDHIHLRAMADHLRSDRDIISMIIKKHPSEVSAVIFTPTTRKDRELQLEIAKYCGTISFAATELKNNIHFLLEAVMLNEHVMKDLCRIRSGVLLELLISAVIHNPKSLKFVTPPELQEEIKQHLNK